MDKAPDNAIFKPVVARGEKSKAKAAGKRRRPPGRRGKEKLFGENWGRFSVEGFKAAIARGAGGGGAFHSERDQKMMSGYAWGHEARVEKVAIAIRKYLAARESGDVNRMKDAAQGVADAANRGNENDMPRWEYALLIERWLRNGGQKPIGFADLA
jgi:hypothetical protein